MVVTLVHAFWTVAAVGESRRTVHFIAEISTIAVTVAPEVRGNAVAAGALEGVVLERDLFIKNDDIRKS